MKSSLKIQVILLASIKIMSIILHKFTTHLVGREDGLLGRLISKILHLAAVRTCLKYNEKRYTFEMRFNSQTVCSKSKINSMLT